jgi:hypothetical protein
MGGNFLREASRQIAKRMKSSGHWRDPDYWTVRHRLLRLSEGRKTDNTSSRPCCITLDKDGHPCCCAGVLFLRGQ